MLLLRFGLHTLLNKAADDDADDSRHDNICLFFLGGGDISSFVSSGFNSTGLPV